MTRRSRCTTWVVLPALLAVSACVAPDDPGDGDRDGVSVTAIDDPQPDSLYADFLDGKFDEAGHPIGASVMQAEDGCDAETGRATSDGARTFAPALDGPGLACSGPTHRLGRGRHTVSVRAALLGCERDESGACAETAPALEVRVTDGEGTVLGEQLFDAASFEARGAYENVSHTFWANDAGELLVEVRWLGEVELAIDYVEIFRQDPQLVVSPPSGVIDDTQSLRIEMIEPSDDDLLVRCNGEDLTARLASLLDDGSGTDERTEFRRIVTVPQAPLFEDCGPDRVIEVLRAADFHTITSEVRQLAEPPPCTYEGTGGVRVLLTGFVPFPAGSRSTNSSSLAVAVLDPATVPHASVMRLFLPVEFEAAAAIARDAIERCDPDVVVGFGQGRYRVDLETTAYNRRDTSEVSGGVPDNRGVILDGAPVEEGGPDTVMTRLPIDAIEMELVTAGIDVGTSTDPGLYVCNDLFYSMVRATREETRAGFVHLPRVFAPTEEHVSELRTVVEAVVRQTAEAANGG